MMKGKVICAPRLRESY